MQEGSELRIAVLIDADNVPYAHVKGMLEEISRYGTPTIKRIYGDWTSSNLSGRCCWKTPSFPSSNTVIRWGKTPPIRS